MSTYSEKLRDPRWQRRRLEILGRDSFACVVCEDTTTTLHVHHVAYVRGRDPWEYSDRALVTLCERCHERAHGHKAPAPRWEAVDREIPNASTPWQSAQRSDGKYPAPVRDKDGHTNPHADRLCAKWFSSGLTLNEEVFIDVLIKHSLVEMKQYESRVLSQSAPRDFVAARLGYLASKGLESEDDRSEYQNLMKVRAAQSKEFLRG